MGFLRRLGLVACAIGSLASAGCSVKSTVVATSSSAANVSHFYITVTGFSLNTSATARLTDGGWVQVTLKAPVTIDLVDPSRALPTLVTGAGVPAGTYRQVLLSLLGRGDTLAASATALNLSYNNQTTYIDSSGASQTVPVEFGTAEPAILVPAALVLSGGSSALTSSSASSEPSAITIDTWFDTTRYLHFLTYGNQSAALYSGPAQAYDGSAVGGISGTLDLSALPATVRPGNQGIIATAEQLAADGTRQQAIGNATVQADGTFLIYPLPVVSGGTNNYDLVVHGPGMQTIVVLSVPVKAGAASAATSVSSTALTAVPESSFTVNMPSIKTSAAGLITAGNSTSVYTLPSSSEVDFYETLPSSSAPYLIECAAMDPYTSTFDANWVLTNAPLSVGTYNAGGTITFTNTTPAEGSGRYRVATAAPLFAPGNLDTRVGPPLAGSLTQLLSPSAPLPVSGSTTTSLLTIQISQGTAGAFNTGTLVISHGGVVIQAVDLTAAFAAAGSSGTFQVYVPGLPSGTASSPYLPAQYDVLARVWNSARPASTLTFAALSRQLDLSSIVPTGAVIALP